jgi:hypothetical protein
LTGFIVVEDALVAPIAVFPQNEPLNAELHSVVLPGTLVSGTALFIIDGSDAAGAPFEKVYPSDQAQARCR